MIMSACGERHHYIGFWRDTLKSVSETETYRYLAARQKRTISGELRAVLVVFTFCAVAAIGSLTAAAQDGVPLLNSMGAENAAQQQTSPSTPAPEGVPSAAPTVVLDDAHTLPSTTAPKPPQQLETSQTKTVELTDFQQLVAASLGQTLPIYGQNLFLNVPTTFAPVDRVPVTSDYVIGPGDELLIRAWGQIDLDVHSRVDRNGAVYISEGRQPECRRAQIRSVAKLPEIAYRPHLSEF